MTPLKGKLNAIAISVDRPSTGQSDRSSIDSAASSIQGGVSPIIMKRFLNFTSPEKKICTMNCENCRDIAKQLRTEQVNLLDIPGHGGRRGSTPWSAPCSRKSSCPGPEIIGKTTKGILYRYMPGGDSIQTKTLFDGIVVPFYLTSYQGNIAQKILHFIAQPLLSRTKFYLKANISRDKFYT